MQDIIPLQHDGEDLSAQEAMRKLGIPDKLIGIERSITIASLTEHVEVGREIASPREGDSGITTILEIPCRQVVGGLKAVLGAGIGSSSVEREVKPAVAIAERDFG